MDGRNGAQVIPLHGAQAGRARRVRPRAGSAPASVHPLEIPDAPAPSATVAHDDGSGAAPADRATAALEFLQRRLSGDYAVDDFGFDPDLADHALFPVLGGLYERWFRVEVNGVEHLPADGPGLLVANHAGGLWAIDALMTALAVRREHPDGRHLRLLGADLVFRTPVLGDLARRLGATMACMDDAQRLLAEGELVGVWPEGFKGIGKPFRERYKLQRFGRGGFVQAAVATGAPIIPVSIIGSEEIHPVLGNARTLARLFNLPYFPLTPTFPWLGPLGLVPLPSKWYIEFGEPIDTADLGSGAADDARAVFDTTDRVREIIQSTLYRLLVQRRSVWR